MKIAKINSYNYFSLYKMLSYYFDILDYLFHIQIIYVLFRFAHYIFAFLLKRKKGDELPLLF